MTGFTIQRSGFTRTPELMYSIISDLVAHGFTQVFPSSALPVPVPGTPYAGFTATLEVGATVDPLAATQPWRINFLTDVSTPQKADIFVGTNLQLLNDGTVTFLDKTDNPSTTPMHSGALNLDGVVNIAGATDWSGQSFIYRTNRVFIGTEGTYPMSYRVSVSAHGVTVFVWEDASDVFGNHFSWFSVQRPVDHITGVPTATGHTPLFCVFGLNAKVGKIIVRENDIMKPTKSVDATQNVEDGSAIINAAPQVAITENNRYVITFPNGLNTQRYVYTEELDLIAYTSADVVSQYSDVPITVYGEASTRTYKAMNANGPNNTGMRILMLTAGGPMA
jgi:hypothetical protein